MKDRRFLCSMLSFALGAWSFFGASSCTDETPELRNGDRGVPVTDGTPADLSDKGLTGDSPMNDGPQVPLADSSAGDLGSPAENPLVTQAHVTYQGRFRLPTGASDQDTLAYGGQALGYNPLNGSLFVGCHDWHQELAEVSIPTPSTAANYESLPQATVLQGCTDVTEGTLPSINPGDPNNKILGGNLVYNNRLLTTGWAYYDADCTQVATHGVSSSLDLSQSGDFSGFYKMGGAAKPRAKGGYMTTIPLDWQSRLGGPALTGLGGISITSCASSGVGLTAFDPDDVGVKDPIPGVSLLDYPDPEAPIVKQYFHWMNSARSRGVAFPPGSRSVILIGSRGDTQCYGTGAACNDPCTSDKGTHSAPYKAKMWAFDALDLESVKDGTKSRDSLEPYAVWDLTEMGTSCTQVVGATYDPASGMAYIAPKYGDSPVIHVYKIAVPPS